MRILEEMKVRRLFCDGGMGSLLQARGLKPGELPERWNLTHRDVLISIHRPIHLAPTGLNLRRIWNPS